MNYKSFFYLFFILILASCSKKEEDKVVEKTGIELIALGSVSYGGVLVGEYRDAAVQIVNHGPSSETLNLTLSNPFSIVSRSVSCSGSDLSKIILEAKKDCIVTVRFRPLVDGDQETNFEVQSEKKITLKGKGLTNGYFELTENSWDVTSMAAGQFRRKRFIVKNLGDLALPGPVVSARPSYIIVAFNSCEAFVNGRDQCEIEFEARPTEARSFSDQIQLRTNTNNFLNIGFTANVVPGPPSGVIQFANAPTSLSAAGAEAIITTLPIRDNFNNIVSDNSVVGVNVNSNLLILASNDTPASCVAPPSCLTKNGIISFKIRTRTIKGNGAISAVADQASGYINFPILSGQPFGTIGVTSVQNTMPANGTTQLIVSTNLISDQYLNLVEDGTPIYFELIGSGSISSGATPKKFTNITVNGKTNVIIQAGTLAEEMTLKIYGGPIYNTNNEIVGYSATGEFKITQEPGPAFGTIPVFSNKNAIYANNTPPIDLDIPFESIISIGPVVDRYNNIVKPNSEIHVNIINGFSTSGSLPENSFTLRTDAAGNATFRLVGANTRGFIVSNISAAQATGTISVWAYRIGQLAYSSGTNNVEVSFLHYRADDKPSPNIPWGKAYRPDNSGQLDNFFYGFNKVSDFPRTDFSLNTLFPYFSWDCFFNAQGILISNFCYLPSGEYSGVYNYSANRALSIDGLDVSPVPELVGNTNFNINNKLEFWGGPGGLSTSPTGAKWSSLFNGIMWIDNKIAVTGDEENPKNRGISDWITINPLKKYVLTFIVRDQFGTTSDRNAEVGIIEGDPALVNDPNYLNNLPAPIIITDSLAGPEIIAQIQRYLIVPTGTTNKIKLYFSTKGSGNGAEIKFDDISLKEYVTQNIHDNAVNQAPSIAYMPALDTTLMFGGNSLQTTSYTCDLQNGGSTSDTCYEYMSGSSNRTTLLSSYLDKSDGIVAVTFDETYQGDLGTRPPAMGHSQMVGLDNKVYLFGGYQAGGFGAANGSLFSFDGVTRKWSQPQIQGDSLVSFNEGAPTPRYQNGLLYIPEKNSLYIAGGLSQDVANEELWNTNDDLWKINLNDSTLKWKRVCSSCGVFSNNVYPSLGNLQNTIENFPNAPGAFSAYSNAIKGIKRTNMMWHEATQRVYILVPESNVIKYFDPYNEMFMSVDDEDALYMLKDSFQITYNKELGRVYAYKRGNSSQENSQILYWDMNRDEKQYYKYKFNLHPQAKSYVQDLKFTVYAYGKSYTPRVDGVINENGIEVYAYNQLYQEWRLLGSNSAATANDAQATPIIFRINDATVNQFVASDGHVDLLVTPKGRPGFAGGETGMGNDLNPINIGKDNFNEIYEAQDMITFGQSNCALLENDTVKCWGVNDFGQLGLGLSTPSVGGTSNTIGNNISVTQLFDTSNPANAGLKAVKLFGGSSHACALFNNNKLKCWGNNTYGQLGFDDNIQTNGNKNGKVGDSFGEMGDNIPFVDLGTKDGTVGGPAVEIVDVQLGTNHTCALLKISNIAPTHRVKCWGRNDFGQLGLGLATTQTRGKVPSQMGNGLPYISLPTFYDSGLMITRQPIVYELATGKNHTCISAETSDGRDQLFCWGKNTNGELSTGVDVNGNPDYTNKISPTITSIQTNQIYSLKAGGDHTCMNYNDSVSTKFYCWGRNDFGQLGRGGSDEPVQINLPQNLQMQFRAIDDVTPNAVNVQFIDATVPNSTATFRKVSRFSTTQNHLIELNHQSSQNIADQDFVFEAEIQPIISSKMAILSKYALSTEVGKVTVTGGWAWYIESTGKMSFYVEGRGLVAESATLNTGFQKVRIVRGFDSLKGYNSIKFYRNVANQGWEDITSPLIDNDLTGINLSNNTDSPLVIGSVYDNNSTPGPQKGTYYKGNIGYVWMRVGSSTINFAPGTIPGSSLLADYVDLGSNFSVSSFALGENHTCVVSTFFDVKCFGANDRGQLGYDYKSDDIGSKIDDMGDALNTVNIGTINGSPINVEKIDLGLAHTCVLLDSGNMKCWGANGFGQLGQGNIKDIGRGLAPIAGENQIFIDFVQLEGVF